MSDSPSPSDRDAAGRFVPHRSGNPAGKAPGTRNRASVLRELMAEGEDRAIARTVLDKGEGEGCPLLEGEGEAPGHLHSACIQQGVPPAAGENSP